MASIVTLHKCEYCSYTAKTRKAVTSHENKCSKNPKNIAAAKQLSALNQEIEDIRLNTTSIPDLIKRITTFLLSKGIELTLTSYPDRWSDCVSNSHYSPKGYRRNWGGDGDKHGIPRGYPGWSGQLRGTIKIIDPTILGIKKQEISFSDLTGSWSDPIMNIPYLQSGNGSWGTYFSGDSRFWLYDFPKMHEEWKTNQGEYNLLSKEYNQKIAVLSSEFQKAQNTWVESQDSYLTLKNYSEQFNALAKDLQDIQEKTKKYLKNEYTKNNPIDLPTIPSAFIDNKAYQNAANLNIISQINNPEITIIFEQLQELSQKLSTYKADYPEYFI